MKFLRHDPSKNEGAVAVTRQRFLTCYNDLLRAFRGKNLNLYEKSPRVGSLSTSAIILVCTHASVYLQLVVNNRLNFAHDRCVCGAHFLTFVKIFVKMYEHVSHPARRQAE
jgi:hypothetical protein